MPAKKTVRNKSKRPPAEPAQTSSQPKIPKRIFAQASPISKGGLSIFEADGQLISSNASQFYSDDDVINRAVDRLREAGFEILQVTPLTINIAGPVEIYERAFNTRITAEERDTLKSLGLRTGATFLESPDTNQPGFISTKGTSFEDVLEGVALEVPRYFMSARTTRSMATRETTRPPSATPPNPSYWHLKVPNDVANACNAAAAHDSGIKGQGIRVAMVDSGHYPHPFFKANDYRVDPVVLGPGASKPGSDESGHGTGESANIFALAPDVTVIPVKASFVNTIGAFNAAVAQKPDIITCSWGSDQEGGPLSAADQALAAAIANAVATGITVIFSAGNGHWGFPGQHPDVISVGGVYMDAQGELQASDYASGFDSKIYRNRRVPDLSGLVGMRPKAIYIMLPIEPNDEIDRSLVGKFPNGDETEPNDGWAAFSGTSAAAPQLAGAAALVKQANPTLGPAEVRETLMSTARDIIKGACNPNTGANRAKTGPDTATGHGLVDASKAVQIAQNKISKNGKTAVTTAT